MKYYNLELLQFEFHRIRQMQPLHLAGKASSRLIGLGLGFLLLPLTALLHLAGYRHVTIFADRIGHLALEPDCLIKEQTLGSIPARKWIMLAPPERVANEHLLTYWQPYFRIVRNRTGCFIIASMSQWGLMRYDLGHAVRAVGQAQSAYSTYASWGNRPPLLTLSPADQQWGRQMLMQMGLPEGAWFVCAHAREEGFSPIDESLHSHRNSSITYQKLAFEEIVNRGGWVIRIGDTSMKSLRDAPSISGMPQVIDYAHHPLKSARLDIVLCAMARFILGNTSGVALVGSVFGTPCALTNMVPLAAIGVSPLDLSIPKLHWSVAENRYLSFAEIFNSRMSQSQYNSEFVSFGIRLDENSPEEIRDLAIEMLASLDSSKTKNTAGNPLSDKFLAMLGSQHYSFGTSSRVSSSFLKRHLALFE